VFESPDGLVITTRQVMEDGWSILLVIHDAEDPKGWQFLNGHGDAEDSRDGVIVHIERVIERDPSITQLADLPEGWRAWRDTEDDSWAREPGG
jgi:hypothetical protein